MKDPFCENSLNMDTFVQLKIISNVEFRKIFCFPVVESF